MKTCFCAGKRKQYPCISLKDQQSGDKIFSFPPPLIQAHWEPNMGHNYSSPPRAHVQQGAGWMDGGLRTLLQALNYHSLSSLSTSPLPSSVTWQLLSVLPQLIHPPIFLFSWSNIISESNLLLIISNTDTIFLVFFLVPSLALPNSTPSWSLYNTSENDAGSQREALRPWQRSWGRRLDIRKGGIEPPGNPRASTPITRACLLYYFVLSPTPLTLRGGVPHHLFQRSFS